MPLFAAQCFTCIMNLSTVIILFSVLAKIIRADGTIVSFRTLLRIFIFCLLPCRSNTTTVSSEPLLPEILSRFHQHNQSGHRNHPYPDCFLLHHTHHHHYRHHQDRFSIFLPIAVMSTELVAYIPVTITVISIQLLRT